MSNCNTKSPRRKLRISCRHGSPCSTIVLFSLATLFTVTISVSGHVSGSKLEATEGHNVSIPFQTGLERVDEVRIMRIIGEGERKPLLAKYCSPHTFPICDPIETPHHLQVKGGNVSLFLVNVNISWSGLYTARVITDNHEFEVNTTLVVNQAPVSSSPAPPHSSSPNPPRSTDLRWLVPVTVIPLVIILFGGVCFWKLRMIPCFNGEKDSGSSSSVSVSMNGGGETAEALLTVTRVS
ncbi:uncharacterized protein LOC120481004 [Pimephales promelas]|uniref:uncharacterized protein LOC120481004 n=1 Tax=Pimephales promelas TaxID=90988 RepID=UPI001955D307|nr:uncharacterized protein LOC120481004 [Pimephales promelas]